MHITETVKKYLTDNWTEEEKKEMWVNKTGVLLNLGDRFAEKPYFDKLAKLSYLSDLMEGSDFKATEREAVLFYGPERRGVLIEIKLDIDTGEDQLFILKHGFYTDLAEHNIYEQEWHEDEDPALRLLRDEFDAFVNYDGPMKPVRIDLKSFSLPLRWSMLDNSAEANFKGYNPGGRNICIPLNEDFNAEIDGEGVLMLLTDSYSDKLEKILNIIDLSLERSLEV